MSNPRHLPTRLLAAVTCAIALSLSLAASAIAEDFPPKVERTFTRSCVSGASSGDLTRAQARKACTVALNCLEDKFTLAQFARLERSGKISSNPKVKACVRRAVASIS